MKINLTIFGIIIFLLSFVACNRPNDYYFADFLNQAENATPGKVDSLTILPGYNRAKLRFNIGPDRRVNKLRVSYNTSLSADVTNVFMDIGGSDYGNSKEVLIENLPEATLLVKVVTLDAKGDSSNVVQAAGRIYGDRYVSSLYNRIFQNITTVNGVKQINLQNESGKPQDSTIFYTLQRTIISYTNTSGGTTTVEASPYMNFVKVADIAASGVIAHYSIFKPEEKAIDNFKSATVSINF